MSIQKDIEDDKDDDFIDATNIPEDIIQKDDNTIKNNITIREIKENISKNSLEIADLRNLTESIDQDNSSNKTDDSNPLTPRRIRYIYANVFDEGIDDSNEWTDIKRYRFQKCLALIG